jgi:hypothetical protein
MVAWIFGCNTAVGRHFAGVRSAWAKLQVMKLAGRGWSQPRDSRAGDSVGRDVPLLRDAAGMAASASAGNAPRFRLPRNVPRCCTVGLRGQP